MTRFPAAALALFLLPSLLPGTAAAVTAATTAASLAEAATAPIPVRVRIIKGSRKGPAWLDPALGPMKQQLSKLAYLRWELVSERAFEMTPKKTEFTQLPYGDNVALTIQESNGKNVTIEVALAQRNTQSRLTIEKGQRIIHQVSGEKNGVAYFVTVHVAPTGP
jgi:ABC-type transport system substrate-binding protein